MKKLMKEWKLLLESATMDNVVVAIFGPTGCGKTTYKNHLADKGWRHIKSFTTRPPRPLEDSEYHFVSPKEYNDMFSRGLLMNTNRYDGHYYGTNVNDFMQTGKSVIITDVSSLYKLHRAATQNGKDIRFMHCAIEDPEEFERRHISRGTPDRVALMKKELQDDAYQKSLTIPGIRERMYIVYDIEDLDEFVEEIKNE